MSDFPGMISEAEEQRRREQAVEPDASLWVAASAGAGKTTVLTNRVISLLVHGTPPARILCLTFTKAAAAEMAIRINQRLGEWATLDDETLAEQLRTLIGKPASATQRRRARGLFGAVLDVPGGMKIQTIHAFCQSLLSRFPLEAGIAPHFTVLDDRSAAEMMLMAREDILFAARSAAFAGGGADEQLSTALDVITRTVQEDGFADLMGGLAADRSRLRALLDAHGGRDGAAAAIRGRLGLAPGEDEACLCAAGMADAAIDLAGLRAAVARLAAGSATDQTRGATLGQLLENVEDRIARFAEYCGLFLTQAGQPRKVLITQKAAAGSDSATILADEAERLAKLQAKLKAARIAGLSIATVIVGDALLAAYETHKARHAALDYDDLILGARDLLHGSGAAAWVLFKLDGGLDHILVDEAQDTSPAQWQVIAALGEEFFAGRGARDDQRTIFAVGDVKQSIYSFQGADPEAFFRMRVHFRDRVRAAEKRWGEIDLLRSFRSTQAVLTSVDAVFVQPAALDGVITPGAPIVHLVQRMGQAGTVELWPLVEPDPPVEPAPWVPPVAVVPGDSPAARLAAVIAGTVRQWRDSGERLESRNRAVRPGDIMVLVRRRSAFVDELVRCLKARDVPVAGVDRMVLTEQLVVMDLTAFGQFLLLPEDDLTLACVLKSPLVGLDEETLFSLAHGRSEGTTLWESLRRAAARRGAPSSVRAAHELLARYLGLADYLRPYDLFSELLNRDGARKRLLARLGAEAEDPLGEFMSLALDYEQQAVPSLQGFLHWLVSGEAEIKRDLEQGVRDEVRIMTVHGAKGLQAPIVFLPDDTQLPRERARLMWDRTDEDDDVPALPLWRAASGERDAVSDAACARAERKRAQEYRRLLYVALTRAEDRLYVCGWSGKRQPSPDCWYNLVRDGLGGIAAPTPFDFAGVAGTAGWSGVGLRLTSAQSEKPKEDKERVASLTVAPREPLPAWATQAAPAEPRPSRPLAPSKPDPQSESEPAMVSPLAGGFADTSRFQRGLIIHRLLQSLPELAPAARDEAARRYLARPMLALNEAAQAEIAAEVARVLADERFAAVFGPDSRPEVPITGQLGDQSSGGLVLSGQIDRIVVLPERVLLVDYKSNRPPPRRVEEVPAIYLRQLAAYRGLLAGVYPDRPIACALLWTDGPLWMEIPAELLDLNRPGAAP